MRIFQIYTLHHTLSGYQVKECAMDKTVSHGGKLKNGYIILVDEPNGKNSHGDLGFNGEKY
jgi:hypothetical protein